MPYWNYAVLEQAQVEPVPSYQPRTGNLFQQKSDDQVGIKEFAIQLDAFMTRQAPQPDDKTVCQFAELPRTVAADRYKSRRRPLRTSPRISSSRDCAIAAKAIDRTVCRYKRLCMPANLST